VSIDSNQSSAALAALVDSIKAELREELLDELRAELDAESPYVSIPEAAELLRCKRQRIDDLLSAGALPRVHEGRRVLIPREAINRHLRKETR
jgi:excisionase family DNA binding protein